MPLWLALCSIAFPDRFLDLSHSPHAVKTQAFCQLLCYNLEADSLHFPLLQSYITITLFGYC